MARKLAKFINVKNAFRPILGLSKRKLQIIQTLHSTLPKISLTLMSNKKTNTMGLFDFMKPKKNNLNDFMANLNNSMLPKGEKDIEAGTKEILSILNNKVNYETAKTIFLRSIAISRLSQNFDEARLRAHLMGYSIQHFDEDQIRKLHQYLEALKTAMESARRTPSEVKRVGEYYDW